MTRTILDVIEISYDLTFIAAPPKSPLLGERLSPFMNHSDFFNAFAVHFSRALETRWITTDEFRIRNEVGRRSNHSRILRLLNDTITLLGGDYLNECHIHPEAYPKQSGNQDFYADAVSFNHDEENLLSGVFQYRSIDAKREKTLKQIRQLLNLKDCPLRCMIFPITSSEFMLRRGTTNSR